MEKTLLDAMSIKLPKSSNPIHFSNLSVLDLKLSKVLRKVIDKKELKRGLPADALRKQNEFKESDDQESFSIQDHFLKSFTIYDPFNKRSDWELTTDWELLQRENVGSYKQGTQQFDIGSLAIRNSTIPKSDKFKLVAQVYMGAKDEVGVVFNFKSADDYWVFIYKSNDYWDPKSVVYIRHVLGKQVVLDKQVQVPVEDNGVEKFLTKRKLTFEIARNGTNEKLAITLKSEDLEIDINATEDIPWHEEQQVGFYVRYASDAKFLNLNYEHGDSLDSVVDLFPDKEGYDEVPKEYKNEFFIETIDLRPAGWVQQLKQLWARKFLAHRRLVAAQTKYDALFASDASMLNISPQDINNAEGLYTKALNEYLLADENLDLLIKLMNSEGFSIDMKDADSSDILGDFDYTINYKQRKEKIMAWKEFYVAYSVFNNVRQRIDYHYNRVRHSTFIGTDFGHYSGTKDGHVNVFVTEKNWQTKSRKVLEVKNIALKNTGNLFDQLESLIQDKPEDLNHTIEQDIRQYQFIDGQYIDQHGISLEEHVIDLTENPKPDQEDVLVVPVTAQSGDQNAEKMIIVRNPIFSGKRIHPTSVHFEEKYMMDVKWDGIGLGEFSHSVNLFPGEERELQLVSSKKRSFETVSKTKTSASSTLSQESATATKRNDSFSSKLQQSMENSRDFATARSSTTTKSISAEAKARWGWGSASAKGSISNTSASASSSSVSAVAKRASDMASQSSSEVSQNNKVSFSSTTNMDQSLEEKVTGEDMESETTKIRISNVNEGRTVNYNFFQVTNTYKTELQVENVQIHVSTGIEIIPGTGITIDKTFEIENFAEIGKSFDILSEGQQQALQKSISAAVLDKYLVIPDDPLEDHPQILHFQNVPSKTAQDELRRLRGRTDEISTELEDVISSENGPLDDELFELADYRFKVKALKLEESDHYTVNSGKYYVEAHVGMKPATEEYLEERRVIETDKQKALVEDIKQRTEKGVFFQKLPDGLTQLSIEDPNQTE